MSPWTVIISLIVILAAPLSLTFSAEAPLKTINVSVPAVSLLQAPLFIAIDAGAFKKYSMEVRYIVTGARPIQALVGGSVHFAQGVSSRTVPSAVLAGADTVLIANFNDKLLFTMHSAPEINSLQDLKGKIVGVSGREYFHRQIWISFVDDPLGVKMVGNVLDADKVMFGSDYPHPASTWPDSQKVIDECTQSVAAEVCHKIFRDNARGLFGI